MEGIYLWIVAYLDATGVVVTTKKAYTAESAVALLKSDGHCIATDNLLLVAKSSAVLPAVLVAIGKEIVPNKTDTVEFDIRDFLGQKKNNA